MRQIRKYDEGPPSRAAAFAEFRDRPHDVHMLQVLNLLKGVALPCRLLHVLVQVSAGRVTADFKIKATSTRRRSASKARDAPARGDALSTLGQL